MQELLRTPTAMLGPDSTAMVYLSCCCLAWHLIDLSWFQTPTMPGSSPNLRSPAAHRQIGPEIPARVARAQLGVQSQPSGEDLNQSLGSHVATEPPVCAQGIL